MGKWLAAGGVVLLVALILLWHAMDSSATPPVVDRPSEQARAEVPAIQLRPTAPKPTEAEPEPEQSKKLDPKGDEFFNRFIEEVPHKVLGNAVECYNHRTGSLGLDQKLVLQYNVKIRNGVVTVQDVKIKPDEDGDKKNTLDDPALESCFIQKVARTTWTDGEFPDYEWPDEIVLRPERGMKKMWKSNLDYVGAEAPKVHPYEHKK